LIGQVFFGCSRKRAIGHDTNARIWHPKRNRGTCSGFEQPGSW